MASIRQRLAAAQNVGGVGTNPGVTGLTIREDGNAALHKTTFRFENVAVPLADAAGVVAYGGLKIYDMPEGTILFLGASTDLDVTKTSAGVSATFDGDVGMGSATASNNATLSSTEQDVIPTTATPQAVAGVTTANANSTITQAGVVLDGTTTPVDLYLNFLVDDADHNVTATACNLILNGTATVVWTPLGDD